MRCVRCRFDSNVLIAESRWADLWSNPPVTEFPHQPLALPPRSGAAPSVPPPQVYAAVVLTWIGATATAALTVFLSIGIFWVGANAFEAFDAGTANPRWWLSVSAVVVVMLCAIAALLAREVLLGHRWAWWGLVTLSLATALSGAMTSSLIVPILVAVFALAVLTLLMLPRSRAWVR